MPAPLPATARPAPPAVAAQPPRAPVPSELPRTGTTHGAPGRLIDALPVPRFLSRKP
jgi:hypothetical protein